MPVSTSNSTYFYTSSGNASPGAVSSYLSTSGAQPTGAQQSQRQQQNPGRVSSTTSTYVMPASGSSSAAVSSYLVAGKAQPQGAQQSQRQQQNSGGVTSTNSTYIMQPGARAIGNASVYQAGRQTANNTPASTAQDPTKTTIYAPASTQTAIASLPRNPMVTAMLPPMGEELRTAVYPLTQDSQTAVPMDQTAYFDAPTDMETPNSTRPAVTQLQTSLMGSPADTTHYGVSGASNASGPSSVAHKTTTGPVPNSVYVGTGAQGMGVSNTSVYYGAGGASNAWCSTPVNNATTGLSNTSVYVESAAQGVGADIQSVYIMAK